MIASLKWDIKNVHKSTLILNEIELASIWTSHPVVLMRYVFTPGFSLAFQGLTRWQKEANITIKHISFYTWTWINLLTLLNHNYGIQIHLLNNVLLRIIFQHYCLSEIPHAFRNHMIHANITWNYLFLLLKIGDTDIKSKPKYYLLL